jgi:hypothetical protein
MKSLPEPTNLEIQIDEWQVAQSKIDAVRVAITWRGARNEPVLARLLAALPPGADLVPIRLVDGRTELAFESWKHIRFGKGQPIFESARHHYEGYAGGPADRLAQARKRLTDMIRPYVPNFDNYTDKEQADFIIRTQEKINAVRNSVAELALHLEYGTPTKKAMPPLEEVDKKVRAAAFSDVLGSSKRVGDLLDIPLAPSDKARNENQRVRKMAKLGRELLYNYFGEEGWKIKVERMREYHQWWRLCESLDDPKDQFYALLAKACGTFPEHERANAEKDGLDKKLDEWIALVELRFKLEEILDHWEYHDQGGTEWTDTESKRRSIQDEQFRIQGTDQRFDKALSVFDAPPDD